MHWRLDMWSRCVAESVDASAVQLNKRAAQDAADKESKGKKQRVKGRPKVCTDCRLVFDAD